MMAADAFANANSTHTPDNPPNTQLERRLSNCKRPVFGDQSQSLNLSSAATIVLGLNGRSDSTFSGGLSLQAIPFANSVGQGNSLKEDKTDGNGISSLAGIANNRRISRQDGIVCLFLIYD